MSIQNEINRIKSGVSSAYDTIAEMGGAVPTDQSIDSLSSAINSIPRSNLNLLEDWYFLDPINQRGQTEYVTENMCIYAIDRWVVDFNTSVSITNSGIALAGNGGIFQPLEHSLIQFISGKTVTLSALLSDNTLLTRTSNSPDENGLSLIEGYGGKELVFRIAENLNVKAVKLELGSQQTLARQDESGIWVLNDPPPNNALELAKCQRYFNQLLYPGVDYSIIGEIAAESNAIVFDLSFPTMRISPVTINNNFSIRAMYRDANNNILAVQESNDLTVHASSRNCITIMAHVSDEGIPSNATTVTIDTFGSNTGLYVSAEL